MSLTTLLFLAKNLTFYFIYQLHLVVKRCLEDFKILDFSYHMIVGFKIKGHSGSTAHYFHRIHITIMRYLIFFMFGDTS